MYDTHSHIHTHSPLGTASIRAPRRVARSHQLREIAITSGYYVVRTPSIPSLSRLATITGRKDDRTVLPSFTLSLIFAVTTDHYHRSWRRPNGAISGYATTRRSKAVMRPCSIVLYAAVLWRCMLQRARAAWLPPADQSALRFMRTTARHLLLNIIAPQCITSLCIKWCKLLLAYHSDVDYNGYCWYAFRLCWCAGLVVNKCKYALHNILKLFRPIRRRII